MWPRAHWHARREISTLPLSFLSQQLARMGRSVGWVATRLNDGICHVEVALLSALAWAVTREMQAVRPYACGNVEKAPWKVVIYDCLVALVYQPCHALQQPCLPAVVSCRVLPGACLQLPHIAANVDVRCQWRHVHTRCARWHVRPSPHN